jgi:SAM-dependent methyltransferase
MRNAVGEYTDWRFIDYKPAIAEILPSNLLPYLYKGQAVLDIGCNIGSASSFLANQGLNVLGVDINSKAIKIARKRVKSESLNASVRFMTVDIAKEQCLGAFDVVLMIRLLTCFPSLESWQLLLKRAFSQLKDGGIIYINDFMLAAENDVYRMRYEVGASLGWRYGNFAVNDASGHLLFVAHHHSEEELQEIMSPYSQRSLHFYKSLSMNGNECNMFEFIGQKSP